jgi:hypothetical protein
MNFFNASLCPKNGSQYQRRLSKRRSRVATIAEKPWQSDYEAGYGKPPKHSRFKKGVCANPRGRGKRERTGACHSA